MRAFAWHEGDSFLHGLNPLTKLALNVPVVAVVSLIYEPVTPLLIALLAVAATRYLGHVPWATLARPLGVAGLLSLGMFWTNALFYAGPGLGPGTATVQLGPVAWPLASLVFGAAMAARLLAIFATSMLFVLTTDPHRFILALIQQGHLPYRLGYSVFAAYRFVPLLHVEFEHIRAAHQVRGLSAGRGLLTRVRQLLGYAVPLMAVAVRKAERVALAMDSRAFGALPQRTYYRTSVLSRQDAVFTAGSLAMLSAVVGLHAILRIG